MLPKTIGRTPPIPSSSKFRKALFHKPFPSLEGMTRFIVLREVKAPDFSDYWQQRTKSHLSRVHVVPKTLFTPSHAPVDLALLAPGRETRKCYLNGSILTLHDTWFGTWKCQGQGQ